MVRAVREHEAEITGLSDAQLRQLIHQIRAKLRNGATEDHVLPEVFAAVCVAARRTLQMRPYNVQLVGGYELHRGRIAEMATGEGKTLVATLPASLNAISGRGVHVVTVNDYLARRDCDLMSPVYNLLGLSTSVIVTGMTDGERRQAYRADVVYATNKELGFDYLRDQIKLARRQEHRPIDTKVLLNLTEDKDAVMRPLNFALVDEADSVFIDEARTPLIIASPAEPSPLAWAYQWADRVALRLRPRHDFDLKVDKRQLTWREEGLTRLQKILKELGVPSLAGESWQNMVLNALKAQWLFRRQEHYVIAPGPGGEPQIVIIDESTGRQMEGRTWNEGLHQAVQARENVAVMTPSRTLARTTYQHFFSLYPKLGGMTGTAGTEHRDLRETFRLRVTPIPTHRPVRRKQYPTVITRTRREKWQAVADEILMVGRSGRPVLVGTQTIEDSEALSAALHKRGIQHQLLNARPENAGREAAIVAAAGQHGAVTIATNMAGRGTDIKLGLGVAALGGLHVISTQMHDSRRIDLQLIGRCSRQGDPGSYRFILSLQDAILEHTVDRRKLARMRRAPYARFGHKLGEMRLLWLYRRAQLRMETLHYRQRKQLMEYEDWINKVYYQMGTR